MKKIFILFIFLINLAYGQSVTITPGIIGSNQDNVNTSQYNLDLKAQNGNIPNVVGTAQGGTFAAPTAVAVNSYLLSVRGRGYDGSAFTASSARMDFRATENWTSTGNGSAITFLTTPNGGVVRTERMKIDQNGFIGIGSGITPTYKFHISGNETEKLLLENQTALGSGIKTEMYFKTGTYFTGAIKTIGNDAQAARLGLFTNANTNPQSLAERVSIADGGNVGINNINPLESLHVVGNIRSSNLAGTGVRNVTADANGTLSTAAVTKYYSAPYNSFVKDDNPDGSSAIYYLGRASVSSGTNVLECPVHIPNGATLINARVYYLDANASNDLQFSFVRYAFATNTLYIGNPVYSSGSTTSNLFVDINLNSSTVNNQTDAFSIWVQPKSGSVWTTGNTLGAVGVVITYTE